MREDRYAAGVVAVRLEGEPARRTYLLLNDGNVWDFSKGTIKENETELAAALRELEEETAIRDLRVCEGLPPIVLKYRFTARDNHIVVKHVTCFVGITGANAVTTSNEHVRSAFFPYDQALQVLRQD